jgi:hypothetical protein
MTAMADHEYADRIAGWALILGALLSVFAMAHHPEHVDPNGLVGIVHGAMLVLMTATAFGFAHFALRRGVRRPAILAGLIPYFVGVVADLGAATTNGFIVPALAAHGTALSGRDVFLLAWEANQALAKLGVFATAAAFALWSFDFLRRPGLEPRIVGGLGLVAALGPAILLATGTTDMHVGGAFIAYAAFALWGLVVGLHLVRGRLGELAAPSARA